MKIENGAGQEPIIKNRSEVAFDALREQLRSNSKLDFVAGFHHFPKELKLHEYDHKISMGDSAMFVAPKIPTLDLREMNALMLDLYHEFCKDKKIRITHTNPPEIYKGKEEKKREMYVATLFFDEIIDTIKATKTTVYSWEEDNVLNTIPTVIRPATSVEEVNLTDYAQIIIFPDRISAKEAAEKWEKGDRSESITMLTSEQIKNLEQRNKKRLK